MFASIRRPLLLLPALVCALAFQAPGTAAAGTILNVVLDPDKSHRVSVGVRDAGEQTPEISPAAKEGEAAEQAAAKPAFPLTIVEREETAFWKPFLMMVDTTNTDEARLARIRAQVLEIARRELGAGSQFVWVNNESSSSVQGSKPADAEAGGQVHGLIASLVAKPNPDPRNRTPQFSPISPYLEQLLKQGTKVTRGKPTALVFSSLCVGTSDAAPESLPATSFPGPVRIFTWDEGLGRDCKTNKARWLTEARALKPDLEVLNLDDKSQEEAIAAALLPRSDVKDEIVTLDGVPYKLGILDIVVSLEGAEPIRRTWGKDDLQKSAPAWPAEAQEVKSGQIIKWSLVAFVLTVLLLILGALFKARSQGMDVARWEAVGEAEDLSDPLEPDAWNATIFQLTGAMPALTEIKEATQLGPGKASQRKDESTVDAPRPQAEDSDTDSTADEDAPEADGTEPHDEAPTQVASEPVTQLETEAATQLEASSKEEDPTEESDAEDEEEIEAADDEDEDHAPDEDDEDEPDEDEAAAKTAPTPTESGDLEQSHTGMTVGMPVLDDGTGYDADSPFEIGVLQFGRPVARKTKRFRKVFSIGRATDNRVVIQKDDTVHRYHVVIRPAVQGKEWWLEVSPTASNRTNLNGKDLRSGGRYRLPPKFRLQLGEATEVRGRLVDP